MKDCRDTIDRYLLTGRITSGCSGAGGSGPPHDTAEADTGPQGERQGAGTPARVRPPREWASRRWRGGERPRSGPRRARGGERPAGPPGSTTSGVGGERRVRHMGGPTGSGSARQTADVPRPGEAFQPSWPRSPGTLPWRGGAHGWSRTTAAGRPGGSGPPTRAVGPLSARQRPNASTRGAASAGGRGGERDRPRRRGSCPAPGHPQPRRLAGPGGAARGAGTRTGPGTNRSPAAPPARRDDPPCSGAPTGVGRTALCGWGCGGRGARPSAAGLTTTTACPATWPGSSRACPTPVGGGRRGASGVAPRAAGALPHRPPDQTRVAAATASAGLADASLPEEPGASTPPAGICAGAVGSLAVLPRWAWAKVRRCRYLSGGSVMDR